MTHPSVGAPAPDFTLPATNGSSVTLSALKGKPVLLAFFPLAFTGTCTAEMCEFSEDYQAYTSRGAAVFPISVDSIPTLKAFQAHSNIQVDLLSDFHREVARLYGVLDEEKFFAQRAYFLIDAEGKLNWAHVESQLSDKRNTEELLNHLDALG